MDPPKGAPEGAYFYTLTWAQLFLFLFALVAEFERRVTADSSDDLSSSAPDNDDDPNDDNANDDPNDAPPPPDDSRPRVPTPPPFPPPNWRPQRGDKNNNQKDRERSPRR